MYFDTFSDIAQKVGLVPMFLCILFSWICHKDWLWKVTKKAKNFLQWECHEEFHHNHQISRMDDQDSLKIWEIHEETSQIHSQGMRIWGIQDHKVTTGNKGMKIIEIILSLTEITDMTKTTGMDVNRHDLMRGTSSSIIPIIISTHIDLLL